MAPWQRRRWRRISSRSSAAERRRGTGQSCMMNGLCLGYVWVMSGLYLVSFGSQTFQFALEHE